jgi:hypothetical protein
LHKIIQNEALLFAVLRLVYTIWNHISLAIWIDFQRKLRDRVTGVEMEAQPEAESGSVPARACLQL